MAKPVDIDLARQIREESERTKDETFPEGTKFMHPNRDRSKVYSIRLCAT
jgi:hypothetical protein